MGKSSVTSTPRIRTSRLLSKLWARRPLQSASRSQSQAPFSQPPAQATHSRRPITLGQDDSSASVSSSPPSTPAIKVTREDVESFNSIPTTDSQINGNPFVSTFVSTLGIPTLSQPSSSTSVSGASTSSSTSASLTPSTPSASAFGPRPIPKVTITDVDGSEVDIENLVENENHQSSPTIPPLLSSSLLSLYPPKSSIVGHPAATAEDIRDGMQPKMGRTPLAEVVTTPAETETPVETVESIQTGPRERTISGSASGPHTVTEESLRDSRTVELGEFVPIANPLPELSNAPEPEARVAPETPAATDAALFDWNEFFGPYIPEIPDSCVSPSSSCQQRASGSFDGLNPELEQIFSPESGLRNRRPYKGYVIDEESITDSDSISLEEQHSLNDSGIFIVDDEEVGGIEGEKDLNELFEYRAVICFNQPAVLPLPNSHTINYTWKRWERALGGFTIYKELKIAEYAELSLAPAHRNLQYEQIHQRLQDEWKYIGTVLIGLVGFNGTIFALSPSPNAATTPHALSCTVFSSSLLTIDMCTRPAASLSMLAAMAGLFCDCYFWFRYCGTNVETFLNRASSAPSSSSSTSPPSGTSAAQIGRQWQYFALSARIPALCMLFSIICLCVFFFLVALASVPHAVLWIICVLVAIGMCLRHLVSLVQLSVWVASGVACWAGNIAQIVGRGIMTGLGSLRGRRVGDNPAGAAGGSVTGALQMVVTTR